MHDGEKARTGHRVGKGAPFNDLGRLEICDELVVETREAVFTYRVLPMDADPEARRAAAEACLAPGQVDRVAAGDYAGSSAARSPRPRTPRCSSRCPASRAPSSATAWSR